MSATAPEVADGVADPAGVTDSIKQDRIDKREQRRELVELDGKARELFLNRYTDTFSVERHGTEIEFYRPVDATAADPASISEERPDLADRLEEGSRLLNEFDDAHTETMMQVMDDDVPMTDVLERAVEETDLVRRILSLHAVDESFRRPEVWDAVFPQQNQIHELFEDFISEGSPEERQQKLDALQNLRSDGLSET